ncbi:hypothetical protein Poli38472_005216 [Pythium oligandrum]|uniref:CWH43-like N-terminal domain-containing protein n=1 Tax=Pythium oligandrum TaxID=41045 RepID=A0A8K1CGJ3_PYTOL|nr:hypothetical protein Poli38472_005216 [Pythium oligandrum]|eukprot:TMW62598.1 hypothetical protein Poli38472_005216 [Pythium oligandrum]
MGNLPLLSGTMQSDAIKAREASYFHTSRVSASFHPAPIAPFPFSPTDRPKLGRNRIINQSESSSSDSEDDTDSDSSAGGDAASEDTEGESDAEDSSTSERSCGASNSSLSDSEVDDFSATDDDNAPIRISSGAKWRFKSMNARPDLPVWQSDNIGIAALLIPITGITTMVLTEVLACANHFDCSKNYPTLSYAAEFKPEGYAFTIGMCSTAMLILATVALFHWFLRLRLMHPTVDRATVLITHGCLTAGAISAVSLFGLAVFDMGAYHDAHINFTVTFFIFAWVTMIAAQLARRLLLRDDKVASLSRAPSSVPWTIWNAMLRWKHMKTIEAYRLGWFFLLSGLTSTAMFGLLFLCVNGVWSNPLGFTAVQEAFFEAFAIVCQLLFMGTLSSELALLTRVVEYRDYQELERTE